MDYLNGLFEPGRWYWIIEHAGPFFSVLVATTALTATVVWLVVRARYARMLDKLKEFENKLHGASPDEARRRTELMRARLARLEPRRLTGPQQAVLQKCLTLPEAAGVTDINVVHDAACSDSKQYAADFAQLLRSCRGWQPSSMTMFGLSHRTEADLAIVWSRQGRTATAAMLLSTALDEAGIDHETIHSTEEQLELVVRAKPSAEDLLDDG